MVFYLRAGVTPRTRTSILIDVSSAHAPVVSTPTVVWALATITRTARSRSTHSCCLDSSIAACSDSGADDRLAAGLLMRSLSTLPTSLHMDGRPLLRPGPKEGPPEGPAEGPRTTAEREVGLESVEPVVGAGTRVKLSSRVGGDGMTAMPTVDREGVVPVGDVVPWGSGEGESNASATASAS